MKVSDFSEVIAQLIAACDRCISLTIELDNKCTLMEEALKDLLVQVTPAISRLLTFDKQRNGNDRRNTIEARSEYMCAFHPDGTQLYNGRSDKDDSILTIDNAGTLTVTNELIYDAMVKRIRFVGLSRLYRTIISKLAEEVGGRHKDLSYLMTTEAQLLEEVRLKTLEALREPIVTPPAPPITPK